MLFKLTSIEDVKYLSKFYLDNAEHLKPWEPLRDADYHSINSWEQRVIERVETQEKDQAAYFLSYNQQQDEIIAICNLSNIIRGVFQSCTIGFAVSEKFEGKGVMLPLCEHAVQYAFEELKLNRVLASHLPHNKRSEALLKKLGFTREGYAKNYLYINGKWEDHVLNSFVNPKNIFE